MANGRSLQDDRKLESGTAATKGRGGLHPAFYIALWIGLSSSVIIFNKWILSTAKFNYPLFLTTWHMTFSTVMTQILAHFTTKLDSRHRVPMTPQTYMKAIMPIGVMFSLSLICGNLAYLYLSVSFIQMLKATTAVATLLSTWMFGIAQVNLKTLANVILIVIGVMIASFGEIKFDMVGFLFQIGGVVFEAIRLVMVQALLSSAEFKMDPLVSLYYFAPACAVGNFAVMFFTELPRMTVSEIYSLGISTLIVNAAIAFFLNVSSVLLIGKTSAVVLTMAGVLKDVLLVFASMAIFHDPVTAQQFFGYSISLAGLTYYKLGAEKMNALATDIRLQVGEYRRTQPAKARLILTGAVMSIFILGWYNAPISGLDYPNVSTAH
ncbi:solute carrier 35 member [Aspergillus wentii]|nr:solute carrier 35 member [Aspergillus wentii]